MKKTWILLAGAAVIALGIVVAVQWRAFRSETERARAAEAARRESALATEAEARRAREAEARAERLQREVQEFSTVTSNLRSNAAAQQSNLTALAERVSAGKGSNGLATGAESSPGGSLGKGMGQMLAKMMQDPEMKKMVRGQQKAMLDLMYSGLFKQMRLSPDEQKSLTDLLLDAQMSQVEKAGSLLGGGEAGPDAAQARQAMEDEKKASEARIKELLGDDRFAEYQEYQKTIGERMQVNQLQSKMESAHLPLQEPQVAQLMQFMQEEKTRVPPVLPTGQNANPADLKSLMTAENLDKQMQWFDDYNQRVLGRAASVLTPDQLKVYQDFQEQQTSMQKLGLKMAKDMFGSGDPAPVPVK